MVSPPSHHRCCPVLPATVPPYPLSPSPVDAATALPSLFFSRRHRPLLPTRPLPSPLSPSPAATTTLSSQQGCLKKRRDTFSSEKSKGNWSLT
ncbi:hypothetical protein TIFTF001_021324 [Ficus carica]|uniref:Uncharacterized protein n=1 Tax=Ficus carica TaxID=3494 RepID=A0AA88AHR4_FICCA|nr:hypothetical protein TIFTF001_021324 [Ficus carica]